MYMTANNLKVFPYTVTNYYEEYPHMTIFTSHKIEYLKTGFKAFSNRAL